MDKRPAEYDEVCDVLDSHWDHQDGAPFREALEKLRVFADAGDLDAAEFIAEILALYGPVHDAASAYKWYYIVLSAQGYSVAFEDQNGMPPSYCGPVGDFRNEAMVSGLIDELGFERIKELDSEVAQWMATRQSHSA